MGVTLQDIADRAGVSLGTVDRVVNQRGNVSEKTIKKVHSVMDELDYVSIEISKLLQDNKKSYKIAIIMPHPDRTVYANALKAGFDSASKIYGKLVFDIEYFFYERRNDEELADNLRKIISRNDISGLILKPINQKNIQELVDVISKKKIPVVTCSSDIENADRIAYVGHNQNHGGRMMASMLSKIIQNEGNVLFMTGSKDIMAHRKTSEGFCEYIQSKKRAINIIGVVESYNPQVSVRGLIEFYCKNIELKAVVLQSINSDKIEEIHRLFKNQKNKPTLCSFGYGVGVENQLKEGILDFAIMENPFEQAEISMKIMCNKLLSEIVPQNGFREIEYKIAIDENF